MYEDRPPYLSDLPPALTQEGREAQLIALAYDLAEKRLRDGSATSQEVTHFLKLGSAKANLEQEILEAQVQLYRAKTDAIRSESQRDELYQQVIDSIKRYGGLRDV